MIVQCDECKAKFRLDESRIGANGAKVRCSKCRHVFMVQPPQARDEEEFDSFLDGLGGAPAETDGIAVPAPAPPVESQFQLSSATAGEVQKSVAPPEEEQKIPEESEPFHEGGAVSGAVMDSSGGGTFEFGDDLFGDDKAAVVPAAAGEFDFSDMNPPQGSIPQETVSFDGSGSEFDFSAESDDVPASGSTAEEWGGDGAGGFPDFGTEEPVRTSPEGEAVEPGQVAEQRFDFEGFGDEEESLGHTPEPFTTAGTGAEFDFAPGASDFAAVEQDGPGLSLETPFPAFDLEPPSVETVQAGADEGFTLGEDATMDTGGEMPFEGFGQVEESSEPSPFTVETAEPSDFTFEFAEGGEGSGHETVQSGAAEVQWDISPTSEPAEHVEASAGDAALRGLAESFDTTSTSPAAPELQGELPPLSISSRRKQSALVPILVTIVAIAVVVGIGGTGYYLFNGGTAAFNRLGLGFVTSWLGMETKDEGSISVRKVSGAFTANKEAGELFVVSGEAVNNFRKSRASLQVKAILYGKDGKVLAQKIAFCGNAMSGEQIGAMPWSKIEAAMANQFGDSLVNLGVAPDKGIPFVVVFSQVPKDVSDFAVEAAGSTVAGQ